MRNGAYQEVSDYLRQASKDPDSTEIERCTKPKYDEKAGWLVGCAFRTNNAAGEMVKYANWFVIRGDKVVKLLSANAYRME